MLGFIGSLAVFLLSIRLIVKTNFGRFTLEHEEIVLKANPFRPETYVIKPIKMKLLDMVLMFALVPSSAFVMALYIFLMGI